MRDQKNRIYERNDVLVLKTKNDVEKLKFKNTALTIGSFDGLHLGHRQLVSEVLSSTDSSQKVVMTFDPHPAKILSQNPPPLLFSRQDQEDVLKQLGLDVLFFLPFDKALADLNAEEFIETYIWQLFEPKKLVIGYDFSFGKKRQGTVDLLKLKLEPRGVKIVQQPAFRNGEDIVSSTLLRKLLTRGEVERMHVLLDRPYYLEGNVIQGKKLGRTIGFPTVNLKCSNEIYPGTGVYFARVLIDQKAYKAVGNVGLNPTVSVNHNLKIEFHILDYHGADLYGKMLRFFLYSKIREEKRFESVNALKEQIKKDVSVAQTLD